MNVMDLNGCLGTPCIRPIYPMVDSTVSRGTEINECILDAGALASKHVYCPIHRLADPGPEIPAGRIRSEHPDPKALLSNFWLDIWFVPSHILQFIRSLEGF